FGIVYVLRVRVLVGSASYDSGTAQSCVVQKIAPLVWHVILSSLKGTRRMYPIPGPSGIQMAVLDLVNEKWVDTKGKKKDDVPGRILSATFTDLPAPQLQWEKMPSSPAPRLDGAAIQIKNLLYVFAGLYWQSMDWILYFESDFIQLHLGRTCDTQKWNYMLDWKKIKIKFSLRQEDVCLVLGLLYALVMLNIGVCLSLGGVENLSQVCGFVSCTDFLEDERYSGYVDMKVVWSPDNGVAKLGIVAVDSFIDDILRSDASLSSSKQLVYGSLQ
ncbi:hypothetical protein Dimus_003483, partial [Dionaea muscipula]